MSIKAANNPFPHDPDDNWKEKLDRGGYPGTAQDIYNKISQIDSPDGILVAGSISKTANIVSIQAMSFICRISQNELTNTDNFSTNILSARDNYKRIDILVFTKFSTIVKIQGTEDLVSAKEPDTPSGTFKLSFISIFGPQISEPSEPIIIPDISGKLDRGGYNGTAQDIVDSIVDSVDISGKLDKDGYNGTAKTLKDYIDNGLGFKEKLSNKATNFMVVNDVLFPSIKASKDYIDSALSSITIPDANTVVKGKVKLAGDLGGTADLPTVPALVNKENLLNKATNFNTINNILYPTVEAVKIYADGLVVGLLDDRGSYNASTNLFPTTGGSGVAGAVLKGDLWYVSVAGTLGGKAVNIGDSFRALTDSPAQISSNWSLLSSNLGYVPANDSNVLHKTGSESFFGVKLSTNTTPTLTNGISLINSGTGGNSYSLFISNTSSGSGQAIANSGSGSASYILNQSNGFGIQLSNMSTGTGINISGTNTGIGIAVDQTGTGTGIRVFNSSTGTMFHAVGISGGAATGFRATQDTGSNGLNFVGQNGASETFTVDKIGNVSGKSFNAILFSSQIGHSAVLGAGATGAGFNASNGSSDPSAVGYSAVSSASGAIGTNFRSSLTNGSTATLYEGVNAGSTVFSVNSSGLIASKGINSVTSSGRPFVFGNSVASQNYGVFQKNDGNPLVYIGDANGSAVSEGTVNDFAIVNPNSGGHILLRTSGIGNVGIGTSTPILKFQTKPSTNINIGFSGGELDISAAQINAFNDTGASNIPIEFKASKYNFTAGNVGIGASTPGSKLTIVTSVNNDGIGFKYSPSIGNSKIGVQFDTGSEAGNSMTFNVSNSSSVAVQRMSILGDGNVLIGTTTNNGVDKLQVNGTISTKGIKNDYLSSNATTVFNASPINSNNTTSGNTEDVLGVTGFYFLETFRYVVSDFGMQRLTYFTGASKGKIYLRVLDSNVWTAWIEK